MKSWLQTLFYSLRYHSIISSSTFILSLWLHADATNMSRAVTNSRWSFPYETINEVLTIQIYYTTCCKCAILEITLLLQMVALMSLFCSIAIALLSPWWY